MLHISTFYLSFTDELEFNIAKGKVLNMNDCSPFPFVFQTTKAFLDIGEERS
jgi:hypothetical protein